MVVDQPCCAVDGKAHGKLESEGRPRPAQRIVRRHPRGYVDRTILNAMAIEADWEDDGLDDWGMGDDGEADEDDEDEEDDDEKEGEEGGNEADAGAPPWQPAWLSRWFGVGSRTRQRLNGTPANQATGASALCLSISTRTRFSIPSSGMSQPQKQRMQRPTAWQEFVIFMVTFRRFANDMPLVADLFNISTDAVFHIYRTHVQVVAYMFECHQPTLQQPVDHGQSRTRLERTMKALRSYAGFDYQRSRRTIGLAPAEAPFARGFCNFKLEEDSEDWDDDDGGGGGGNAAGADTPVAIF
eukprot:m.81405 g.81405  ORF g.81405 m.81405 type:complete len:298 (-) comp14693_c0_seq1:152-1045(-)